jgi:hypothetical protein
LSSFEFSDGINDTWDTILQQLSSLCVRVCKVCAVVCSSPCPEGNLPGNLQNMTDIQNLSQILLRHCFRALESASGCFIKIAQLYLIKNYSSAFKYLGLVGNLLQQYLVQLRHRGAYLAVQANFEKLCKFIINSPDKTFHQLTWNWLQDYVSKINSIKVSVTRRSAGLPAGILSIIVCPDDELCKSQYLDFVLKTVFQTMQSNVEVRNEQTDLAQVHAMNVLRYYLY